MTGEKIRKITDWTFEFVCERCGRGITHLGPEPKEPVCGMCAWIDEFISDPLEREQLRDKLINDRR